MGGVEILSLHVIRVTVVRYDTAKLANGRNLCPILLVSDYLIYYNLKLQINKYAY